jgi:hypothetical protein
LRALDAVCNTNEYLQTGANSDWGFGVPKFANIDWTTV